MSEAQRMKEIIDGLEHALKNERHRYEYGKEPMLQTDTIIPIINARNYLDDLRTAALRAQEQREPMTCEGCRHDGTVSAWCEGCTQNGYFGDNYEPKGAHQ